MSFCENEAEELRCSSQRDYTRTAWWDFPRLHEKRNSLGNPGKGYRKQLKFIVMISCYFLVLSANISPSSTSTFSFEH